jgi:quinol monooxygenase YgiN
MYRRRQFFLGLTVLVGSVVMAIGQQPDPAIYGVAYFEVVPSSASRLNDAFKRYRDASARESGFVKAEILVQRDRPSHFVLLESWKDQGAFDGHQAAASTMEFRNALQPIRLSGYDQRPYKIVTVDASRAERPRNAVHVVAHVDIGGGGMADVAGMLRQLAETSRKEKGNLRFDILQHTMRANHFTVVETWESQQALDQHAAAEHTKKYRDEVMPLTGSPLDERVLRAAE